MLSPKKEMESRVPWVKKYPVMKGRAVRTIKMKSDVEELRRISGMMMRLIKK
jgi:hypothetical protein